MGVESKPGTGSLFWFTLKTQAAPSLCDKPATIRHSEPARPVAPAATPHPPAIPHETRILLVEDHLVNQKVALMLLKKLGYGQADCAVNGQEAVRMVQERDYDLVLMDCQIPVMDGYAATRQIRKLEDAKFKELPIIALTAHAMKGDDDKCYAAGMDDYLTKPVHPEHLRNHIDKWLYHPALT